VINNRSFHLPHSPAFLLFVVFILACAFCGGAARADVASLLTVRIFAVLVLVAAALGFHAVPGQTGFAAVRIPACLLVATAILIGLQLVPLPPTLWTRIPGRVPYEEAALAAGFAQPWRPINLTPDLGWNSFLAVLPPLAALVGYAGCDNKERFNLLAIIVGIGLCSALLGVIQFSQGPMSAFYTYAVTNVGSSVGLFANRNHQALLLALTLPALAVVALVGQRASVNPVSRLLVAAALGIALLPMILVTGSRAGVMLGAVGIVLAGLLTGANGTRKSSIGRRTALTIMVLVAAGMVLLTIGLSHATALQRLFDSVPAEEGRFTLLGPLASLARNYMPFGSGFGSFDTVYRQAQPLATLGRSFLNHAHNEPIELAIEGGLPALAIGATFLAWLFRHSFRVWRRPLAGSQGHLLARLGSGMTIMALLASLPDYPLRTPLIAVVIALACAWLADGSRSLSHPDNSEDAS
jgi:hypothetical protein